MKNKIFLILLIVLFLSAGIIVITKVKQNKASNEVINVITPTYGNIEIFISTTGVVQPQNRVEIKPAINGRIEEILVNEGDKVKKGQILAWMSSTDRAAILDFALSQGKEAMKYWENVYKPTPLIAPINGTVIVRAIEPGQSVTTSTAVLVLSDRLIVKAQVDETDIGKVKLKQDAIISLDAYPQIKIKGKVDKISYESKIVNNVTIYEVDILPERIPSVFRSGMSANVNIVEKSKKNVLLIPLEAVHQDKEGHFVLLNQENGMPLKQRVKLGISDEKNVEVISGLDEDSKIIIKGQKYQLPKSKTIGRNPFMPPRPPAGRR
jgi:macrolide-specific efflux system membrane fusion protein